MKKLFLGFLILNIITSCGDDDEPTPNEDLLNGNSTIVATILDNNSSVREGITVITDPFTYELKTDAFGQVEFEDIQSGKYDVYAYANSYGSGKSIVELQNDLQRIDIDLIQGVLIEPYVNIISPEFNQGFAENEEIEFIANVNDNNTNIEDLNFEWESDIDGILSGGSISTEGRIALKTSSLTSAEHYVKLTVINQLGISTSDSVLINTLSPNSLSVSLTQDSDFNILIDWSSTANNISSIEVYRSTNEYNSETIIATLSGNETSFTDSLVPFTDSVFYYVKAFNTDGYSSKSNVVGSKGTPVFNINAEQAEMLSSSSIIYLRSGNQIIGLDYENPSISVESSFDGTIGYFHIGNNGFDNELYIPNSDGWLYIYDLTNFTLKESLNVGVPVECVISDNAGLLYISVSPSPWWEDPLRVFNRSSLSFVDGGGDFDDTRLKLLPSGNEIIEITTTIGPTDMDYYQFDATGNFTQHTNDQYHGDHPLDADIFKVAPSNNYLVTSSKGAVYNANSSMTYIGSLPRGSDTFSDFEFNSTATLIYAGLSTQKAIHIYDYQSLNKTGEIETKGYPVFLFRKGNELIVISSPTEFDNYNGPQSIGVEVHQL
jgi:hypothetical protein